MTSNVGVNWYLGLLIVGAGLVAKMAGARSLALSIEIEVITPCLNLFALFDITFICLFLIDCYIVNIQHSGDMVKLFSHYFLKFSIDNQSVIRGW
jgi:hypothetical protein